MNLPANAANVANKITDFLVLLDDLSQDDYDLALGYVRGEHGHGELEDKFVDAALALLTHYKNKNTQG